MTGKWFDNVVLMVLENHGWSQVQTCNFVKFFSEHGTTFTNWKGATHPSGPNYRALLSGNIWSNNEFDNVQRPNVAVTVPYVVYNYAGQPADRHNPFLDMNPSTFKGCQPLQNDKWFITTPITYLGMDDQNDAHSGPLSVADNHVVVAATEFLAMQTSKSVMFMVFDEAFGTEYLNNHVFAAMISDFDLPKQIDTELSHYDFAATLAANWNINLPEMNPLAKNIPFWRT